MLLSCIAIDGVTRLTSSRPFSRIWCHSHYWFPSFVERQVALCLLTFCCSAGNLQDLWLPVKTELGTNGVVVAAASECSLADEVLAAENALAGSPDHKTVSAEVRS